MSRIDSAMSAVRKSPATNSPSSSMRKQRSASPSHAIPRSTPSATTRSTMERLFTSSIGLGPSSGNAPSASQCAVIGSSPSRSSSGPTIGPAMPWLPSTTRRSGRTASASMKPSAASWKSG